MEVLFINSDLFHEDEDENGIFSTVFKIGDLRVCRGMLLPYNFVRMHGGPALKVVTPDLKEDFKILVVVVVFVIHSLAVSE